MRLDADLHKVVVQMLKGALQMTFADGTASLIEQGRNNVFYFSEKHTETGVSKGKPGVAIVGAIDSTCNHLIDICQHEGIYFRIFPNLASLEAYAGQPVLSLAIVVEHPSKKETKRTLMSSLWQYGVQRTVLVGPFIGTLPYLEALDDGFDEVWPDALGANTLKALVLKSWQTTQRFVKPVAEPIATRHEIVLRPEACSCAVGGDIAYLSRSCFVVMQCLVSNHPEVISRAELLIALGKVVPGLDERSRAVDMAIFRLRKQLSAAGIRDVEIRTVDHVGYGLEM
jgi:DNA-binding winged helix-turn-helix (wHTH) protein